MLVIRFFRVGKKNQPSFKIIITDKRKSSTGGTFVEEVGFWNPITKEKVLKKDRILYWISVGAKPLPSVHNLLISEKIIEGKKIPVHKKPKPKEPAAASASAEASADKKAMAGKEKPAAEVLKPETQKEPSVAKAMEDKKPSAAKAIEGKEKKKEDVSSEASAKEEKPVEEKPKELEKKKEKTEEKKEKIETAEKIKKEK